MRRISLEEYERHEREPLSPAVAGALAATKLVKTSFTVDGRLLLRAGSTVGAATIQVGPEMVELRVRPKITIGRLLWMLGYAHDPGGWREDPVGLSEEEDLIPAMAVAFAAAASRALAPGVLQGYRMTEEALLVLRGRLREADQIRTRLGLALPVEVRYDDYTGDIPENQILISAVRRLFRLPGVPPTTRNALHRIAAALADVTPLTPGMPAPDTPVNRLNGRYQFALRLARLILAGTGIEQSPGPVQAVGFAFDLNSVFEDWLTAVLREAIETNYGGRVVGQHEMYIDADGNLPPVRPDITWWGGGHCLAVIDAKYKAPGATPPSGDIYQMLAYCTALKLPCGHLIYASAGAVPADYRILGSGTRIYIHGLDLSAPLSSMFKQIEVIADSICTVAGHDQTA